MVLTDFLCTECVKKSDLMKSKDLSFFFFYNSGRFPQLLTLYVYLK